MDQRWFTNAYLVLILFWSVGASSNPFIFRPEAKFTINVSISTDTNAQSRFVCFGPKCVVDATFMIDNNCDPSDAIGFGVDVVPTDFPSNDSTKFVEIFANGNLIIRCEAMGGGPASQAQLPVPWSALVPCVRVDLSETVARSANTIRIKMQTSHSVSSNFVQGESKWAHFGSEIRWMCVPKLQKFHKGHPLTIMTKQREGEITVSGLQPCVEWRKKSENGDRKVGCWGADDGYYWHVGPHIRDYGFYGLMNSLPIYKCGSASIGLVGETWRWHVHTHWQQISQRVCRGETSRQWTHKPYCNVTDPDGPLWGSCAQETPNCPCCGVYSAECKKIPR